MKKDVTEQWNTNQIERHLAKEVDALIPDIWQRLDLSVPQESQTPQMPHEPMQGVILLRKRLRLAAATAAACLSLLAAGAGGLHYRYMNLTVDSVIGIDVNPSVELSINRRERVLAAEALNLEAEQILSEMDLKGVDLNVAVNAVVGAMVTHGYLDELDNAILVTVNNDSVKKASELRASVVGDIEKTLEENQVQAVVYDQQAVEDEQIKRLADEYQISYGKAYFLKELIEQNAELSMEDLPRLSGLTMEEIAAQIAKSSFRLGERTEQKSEPFSEPETEIETEAQTQPQAESESETETESETFPETEAETESETPGTVVVSTSEPETEEILLDRIEIDYVDYEDGMVCVYFVTFVEWENPTVLVRDREGNSYAAVVEETSKDECTIFVDGLENAGTYTFVLGGLTAKGDKHATTVTGYFEKPEIAEEAEDTDDLEEETEKPSLPERSENTEPDQPSKNEESESAETESGEALRETEESEPNQESEPAL